MASAPPEPRPRLVAVDPDAPPPGRPAARRLARLIPWLLFLLLLISLAGWASQAQRAEELQADVARVTGELETARGALAGYREQIGEVRDLVTDLEARFQELRSVVERDAEAPAPTPESAL